MGECAQIRAESAQGTYPFVHLGRVVFEDLQDVGARALPALAERHDLANTVNWASPSPRGFTT